MSYNFLGFWKAAKWTVPDTYDIVMVRGDLFILIVVCIYLICLQVFIELLMLKCC